eukprot:NODE_11550_length_279_cov_3.955357.p1 GENE.NODE_11550_length_279_cov_3.955357~~NODE_11550_length_279_cov_3.955357.p1  ORF type:complete len:92 (+),score=4.61 NODE_11550_length_279_cov_3.955357:2-277(+)
MGRWAHGLMGSWADGPLWARGRAKRRCQTALPNGAANGAKRRCKRRQTALQNGPRGLARGHANKDSRLAFLQTCIVKNNTPSGLADFSHNI